MSKLIALSFLLYIPFLCAEVLDPIEVQAEKDLDRFTFSSSQKISERDIEINTLTSSLIDKVSGVISTQNGGPGGRVSFFIRGTEARHVAFTLDGMKINDSSNVDRQFDAAFMTSPFLKEVVVRKGPQAVLYGSDAMGGIVELKTRKGSDDPETRLLLNAGSFGTVDGTLSSDWGNLHHRGTLTFTRFHTNGISRLNEKRHDAKEKDSADITQITSSSQHKWPEKWQTDLLVSYVHGKNEFDGVDLDASENRSENDQYIIQQKTNYQISKPHALSIRTGLSRHQRFLTTDSVGQESYEGNLYQNEILYRRDTEKVALLAGVSHEHERNTSEEINREFDLNSFFLQSSVSLGQFQFQAGGRADHHSRYNQFFTGSAGVAYQLNSQRFSIQYSQGFKAPTLYQLYAPEIFGLPIGNEKLVPERNHSWDISWIIAKENWESEVTLFQNRLSNLITFSNSGYLNQGRFIAEGVEFGGKVRLAQFEIAPVYTYQQFREEETAVLRRPYNAAQISISYFPVDSVEINATERWFSARKDLNENGNVIKLNSFSVLDVGIRKAWEKYDVGFQIKNILNREYEELYGHSVLPLSVWLHYGYRF